MTSSILLDHKRRTSDALIMPRASFVRGKQAQAMHMSIANQMAVGSIGSLDKFRVAFNNRNNSIAGKSPNQSIHMMPEEEDKLFEYEDAQRPKEEMEKIRQKTLNTRQWRILHKQFAQKEQMGNSQHQHQHQSDQKQEKSLAMIGMTADSADITSQLAEEHKTTLKRGQLDSLKLPLDQSLFAPPNLLGSLVSVSSPVAEEESNVFSNQK